jgi:hypothetical protein
VNEKDACVLDEWMRLPVVGVWAAVLAQLYMVGVATFDILSGEAFCDVSRGHPDFQQRLFSRAMLELRDDWRKARSEEA